jgi:hypothetical protein
MDRVSSHYEEIHQALCSWVTVSAHDPTEPISPISFEFMDIDDVQDRTATVHSITQIHRRTIRQFERLMDLEFQPVIGQLPGVPVVSIYARPIIREE